MKLTAKDLLLLKGIAKQQFLEIPQNSQLEGTVEPLRHGDRIAIAYFEASIRMLVRMNGGTNLSIDLIDVMVPIDQPDSDPQAEDADWIMEASPKS